MPKKITQNINKDAGLLDVPKVDVPHSQWENKHSNYVTMNIGDIYPIYVQEVMPSEKRRVTMGMISHMSTPIAPILNAQYTEFRCFFVPHRLSADLLAGYKTRKSPWVKVFGEDNASANANIIVPLANQKLPPLSNRFITDISNRSVTTLNSFGGLLDALDIECDSSNGTYRYNYYAKMNYLNLAAYELIYQHKYRNENRESATSSGLYRFLFDGYNRTGSVSFDDSFHKAQREKDYFTGSLPFTQKGDSPVINIGGKAPLKSFGLTDSWPLGGVPRVGIDETSSPYVASLEVGLDDVGNVETGESIEHHITSTNLYADLSSASGVSIEELRLLVKTQELLEKDAIYGNEYISQINSHFGCTLLSEVAQEPTELHKVTISSQMQAIFQTSSTSGEQTVLGTIGANSTTNSGEFEICPLTKFKEWGYLIICAVHKAQNAYDAYMYKPKANFKSSRFDWYTPELDSLGYQKINGYEFNSLYNDNNLDGAVSFNEAYGEYRFVFNKCHGMFEPSRSGALDYWTLAISNYNDIASLYKQGTTELDRAVSVTSATAPQFFDGYGFIDYVDKPMSLHSIPGFDGVI